MYQIESKVEFFISKLPLKEQHVQLRLMKKCQSYSGIAEKKKSNDSFVLQTGSCKGAEIKSVQEVLEH